MTDEQWASVLGDLQAIYLVLLETNEHVACLRSEWASINYVAEVL
jgi:hypothetical protein